jgi:hypothetical protein
MDALHCTVPYWRYIVSHRFAFALHRGGPQSFGCFSEVRNAEVLAPPSCIVNLICLSGQAVWFTMLAAFHKCRSHLLERAMFNGDREDQCKSQQRTQQRTAAL